MIFLSLCVDLMTSPLVSLPPVHRLASGSSGLQLRPFRFPLKPIFPQPPGRNLKSNQFSCGAGNTSATNGLPPGYTANVTSINGKYYFLNLYCTTRYLVDLFGSNTVYI